MARRPRPETRTARLKLPVCLKPYDFTVISPGIALGYRRCAAAWPLRGARCRRQERQLDQGGRHCRRPRGGGRRARPDLVAGSGQGAPGRARQRCRHRSPGDRQGGGRRLREGPDRPPRLAPQCRPHSQTSDAKARQQAGGVADLGRARSVARQPAGCRNETGDRSAAVQGREGRAQPCRKAQS